MGAKARPTKPAASGDLFVAFLRGMNLGRRRLSNAELAGHFEAMQFGGAHVFLASGNVVATSKVDAKVLESRIATGLEEALGYPVQTFVRRPDELLAIVADAPFNEQLVKLAGGKLQCVLLQSEPSASGRACVEALSSPHDRLHLQGRVVYWLPSGGVSQTQLDFRTLEAEVGPTTTRTCNTIRRIVERFL